MFNLQPPHYRSLNIKSVISPVIGYAIIISAFGIIKNGKKVMVMRIYVEYVVWGVDMRRRSYGGRGGVYGDIRR